MPTKGLLRMKRTFCQFSLICAMAGLAMYLCMHLQHEYAFFGHGIGAGGILLWLAILLSAAGYSRTWVMVLAAAFGLFLVAALWIRNRKLWIAPALAAAATLIYCHSGVLALRHMPAPIPSVTPYESDAARKREYAATFAEGYWVGVSGILQTYCFAPEHTTRGFYEGQAKGNAVYSRSLGVPDSGALNVISAARDGVVLPSPHRAGNEL